MKTLIVYGTTYGYVAECAETLQKALGDDCDKVRLMAEKDSGAVDLNAYDRVIIGGSIYMGQVQKAVKQFCLSHSSELIEKRVGLFLSCGLPDQFDTHVANAFPGDLIGHAVAVLDFGGELRTEKMGLGHKLITSMMTKVAQKEGKPAIGKKKDNIMKMIDAIG